MAAEFKSGTHKRKIDDEDKEKPVIAKTPTDLQRLRLEKLMKHPDKPVPIPERPKEKNTPHVPDFVRNVMGSSAGAGSGEFHVYRHLRRKEYARQKFIQEKAEKDLRNEEYHRKLEDNKKESDERTAKKREKRKKRKQRQKQNKQSKTIKVEETKSESEDSDKEAESSHPESEVQLKEEQENENELSIPNALESFNNVETETENPQPHRYEIKTENSDAKTSVEESKNHDSGSDD